MFAGPRFNLLLAAVMVVAPHRALAAQTSPAETATAPASPGIDTAGMDRSVRPGDSFFRYANGTWFERTEIPADRSSYSAGAMLAEVTDRRVADLIQQAARAAAPAGSDQRKIGDYYTSFMDSSSIDAAGLTPLKPVLDTIAAISDRTALARFLGSTLRPDVDVLNNTNFYTENLFGLWVAQDLDDPAHYSPFLLQGGLGMPDRSYYVDTSATMAGTRDKYREHVAAMLKLLRVGDPDAKAKAILDLETRIAAAHESREESGDVTKGNNHWRRADFATKAPGMDWDAYFGAAGLAKAPRFVAWQPRAITGIAALVGSEPLDTWKAYLTFHALQSRSAVLPTPVVQETFAFFGPVITGAKKPRERWKRAVDATNAALGFAIGRRYVAQYFPPAEKARAQAMVANLIAAFRTRIDRLDWMSPSTKAQAKAKLAVLKVGVGYPDRWPSYAGLEVKRGDAFGNLERVRLFQLREAVAKLGKPVDRSEWVMTPQTVNAVNLPAMNALNFPAAILQPPFFDRHRPMVMDYGAMGAVIGHEVSHSFDNSGALFDATGRLHNWWTPSDFKHFEASSKQLVAQYNAYKPFPDLAVNGQQTLGENIADLAGLAAAYDAYRRSLHGRPAPTVAGLTGDQQFFISYGQSWRGKLRDPALRNRILTDGHAPYEYRASTVRNIDAWYAAFDVKPGEQLYLAPSDRVRVW
jgi:predicted metalloendopeptidase